MNLRKITSNELEKVLLEDYIDNFPENERKRYEWIKSLVDTGNYLCYGFFENNDLVAFAFCYEGENQILLDYFAVCGNRKNQGYGSQALKLLIEKFNDKPLIIEVENPHYQKDKIMAERRINFYTRLGMKKINLNVNLYGVEFEIMSSKPILAEVAKEELWNIYANMASLVNKTPKISFEFAKLEEKTYGNK